MSTPKKTGKATIDIDTYDRFMELEKELIAIKQLRREEDIVLRKAWAHYILAIANSHDQDFIHKSQDAITKAEYTIKFRNESGTEATFGSGKNIIILTGIGKNNY